MSIQNRPYVGTWAANKRNVVQWTPDFLVYLNGDTSLPGCNVCHHNINLNEVINSISVDFSTEPGASNCSLALAIPRHYGDSIFRDGNTLLRPRATAIRCSTFGISASMAILAPVAASCVSTIMTSQSSSGGAARTVRSLSPK